MSRTISQIKTTISSRLHGTTLNKLSDFNTICKDAAENMLSRIDPQETGRTALLSNAVYDQVYDYAVPTDFKSPIDIRKQAGSVPTNYPLNRTFSRQFNNQKLNGQFAIVWRDAVQFLRLSEYLNAPAIIDKADSLTENGSWTIGGNASDLTLDTLNYVSGTGSIRADVSSPGSIVNVILRIGNDSSNYYSKTVTAGHFEAFKTGWNLCRFDFSSATETGTVDMAEIDYVRITVTYNTNQTAYFEKTLTNAVDLSDNYLQDGSIFTYVRIQTSSSVSVIAIDNITANIGTYYETDYYSNYLFRNTSGTWIDQPTADTDIVNLSPVSYKIFEAEICKIITQQLQGAMGAFDFTYWNAMLEGDQDHLGLYDQYLEQFPSERVESQTDYYTITDDFPNPNGSVNGEPQSWWN